MELNPPLIETEVDSGAGIITMTGGDQGNLLAPPLLEALSQGIKDHEADPKVRFLLFRSRGAHFCMGMNLEAFLIGKGGQAFEEGVRDYSRLLSALQGCPKTTVAVVEGSVRAGGIGLMAACDVVVAANTADFELTELYLGLLPANVLPALLTQRLSPKKAAYLAQTAAKLGAEEARAIGLIEAAYPPEELEKGLKNLGRRLMRISPEASARYKSFARDLEQLPREERGERAVQELVDLAQNPEILQAVRAFGEGETPPWFHRFKPRHPLTANKQRSES